MDEREALALLSRRPKRYSYDVETFEFGAGNLVPKIVCASIAGGGPGDVSALLVASGDEPVRGLPAPAGAFLEALDDPEVEIVLQNGAFDLACLVTAHESMIVPVFEAVEAGRIRDTLLREKLLNIAEDGDTKFRYAESAGKNVRIRYDLASIERRYGIGGDRRVEVKDDDADDAVRKNFGGLDGLPASAYPPDMAGYSLDDATGTLLVSYAQDERAARLMAEGRAGHDLFTTEPLHVAAALALYLASATGVRIDVDRHDAVDAAIREKITPSRLSLLYGSGIIRPAQIGVIGTRGRPLADKPESRDMARLRALVEQAGAAAGIELPRTPTGAIATDSDTIERVAPHSPILTEYAERESHMKMLTTDLPRMNHPLVHPTFDVLKNTGRTSSSGSKHYPSMNVQNPHPDARQMVIPRDGNLLFSVDYSSIELVTLAQQLFSVFGQSTLRDIINSGVDPHAYLGSSLCNALQQDFADACTVAGLKDPMGVFNAFVALRKSQCPTHAGEYADACSVCAIAHEKRRMFDHYRKFAKPTGLGYPGGLGPETFITYARSTFGVVVDLATATTLRQLWHFAFPEMQPYLRQFIGTTLRDPFHPGCYAYTSPNGMVRSACSFPAAANGFGLQTPASEGGKLAFYRLTRECYDESVGSIVFGAVLPLAFIHDEIFGEVRDDEKTHERILRVSEVMVESMKTICPDVAVKTEACLMERWTKEAKPVYENGRLSTWRPK